MANAEADARGREIVEKTRVAARLGELAYRMRVAAGMTQAQVAAAAGTTQSAISRLEGGNGGRTPSMTLIDRIASACGHSMTIGASPVRKSSARKKNTVEVEIPPIEAFYEQESGA